MDDLADASNRWSDFLSDIGAKIHVATFDASQPVMAFLNERHELLRTFERQTVRYEFNAGPGPEHEAVTLALTPVRVIDDLVEIRVNLSGRLPDGDDLAVIARDETLLANRGSSSAVTITAGDPPTGYVFQVTPRF